MSEPLKGAKLSEAAHLRAMARDRYRGGVEIPDLVRDLELTGIRIAGENPDQTLRSALNADQARWVNNDGVWVPISEKRPVGTEISGRPLADVAYSFVVEQYTSDRVFHYERVKEALLAKGVRIKGRATGPTMHKALAGSPDKFERYPPRGRGYWRWKETA